MVDEHNIRRGKKWTEKKKQLELLKQDKEIAWLDSQPAIVADIQAYEDSLKPEKEIKSKVKK